MSLEAGAGAPLARYAAWRRAGDFIVLSGIIPVYPLTGGLSNRAVSKAIAQALESCGAPPEILPQSVRVQYGILPAETA